MKNIIIFAAITFTLASCSQGSFHLSIKNKSGKSLDSVVVMANSFKIKLININAGDSTNTEVWKDSADVKHHILLLPHFYFKDTSFVGRPYYDDLGKIQNRYEATVDNTFQVSWKFSNE